MVLALALQLTLAHMAGQTGASGKQGMFCNQCHTGGTAPTVTITGPATLMVGASSTYTVTITGGAALRGGFNAAVTAGTLMPGANSRLFSGELTHMAPVAFNAGSVSFSFTLQAPVLAGPLTVYAAGNSTNNSMTNAGDLAATATLNVTVVDPAGGADAGSSGAGGGGGTGGGAGGGSGGGVVSGTGGGSTTTTSDGGVAPLGTESMNTGGPAQVVGGHGG